MSDVYFILILFTFRILCLLWLFSVQTFYQLRLFSRLSRFFHLHCHLNEIWEKKKKISFFLGMCAVSTGGGKGRKKVPKSVVEFFLLFLLISHLDLDQIVSFSKLGTQRDPLETFLTRIYRCVRSKIKIPKYLMSILPACFLTEKVFMPRLLNLRRRNGQFY